MIYTPWGKSQFKKEIAPGIVFYATSGHGGFHIINTLNQLVPEKWRLRGKFYCWYEEDLGWAPLKATFPKQFEHIKEDNETLDSILGRWESWVRRSNGGQTW